MATAVAAPIPRLAPVTTATRPASQCPRSGTDLRPAVETAHSPVQLLVSIQALLQVEMGLGVVAARGREISAALATARTAARMSPGGTRNPVSPSAITSLSAPRLNATTGVPQACASAAAMPKGSSHWTGYRTTAAPAIAAHSDARGTP